MTKRWLRGAALAASTAALLAGGCATQIMHGFVGQPVEAVMAQYGAPANSWNMPDGRRAFQWAISSSYTTPVQANTNYSQYGNTAYANTTVTGGQTYNSNCFYTMYARDAGGQWIIESFQKPNWACQ